MTFPFPIWSASAGQDAYTTLLLHGDGADATTTFLDSAAIPHSVSAGGSVQVDTAQSVFGGASILFNGASDYLSLADNDDWDFGTGDFTIDFRVRFASIGATHTLLSNYAGSSSGWAVQLRDTGTTLNFSWGDALLVTRSWSPSTNTWYHVAIIRAAGVIGLYVNGTLLGATASVSTSLSGSSAALNIGRLPTLGLQYFAGWMDEIRISKGIARWSGNFTPEAGPY